MGSLLPACASVSGRNFLTLLPEQKEIEIGKAYLPYVVEEFDGLYPDREVQEYVRVVGVGLARQTERKLPYEFHVVNSSVMNAFALPGGPVVITRGLLMKLGSESELAAVLAHELGHINARHHARFLEKQFGLSLLLGLGALFLGDRPYGQLLVQFGQVGAVLLSLKFSRDQEREADRYGLTYLHRSGYDPEGMIRVFELFKSLERGGRPPEWLSTHPLPENRIVQARQEIQKLNLTGTLLKDTQEFHRVKSNLARTQASFEEFDKGKKAYTRRDYQLALESFRRALETYPENYPARAYTALLLAEEGRLEEAERHSTTALQTMPEVFLTNYVQGFVDFKKANYQTSLRYMQKANRLIPDHASTHYYLGRNYQALGSRGKAVEHYRLALELSQGRAPWAEDARERLRRLGGL